MILLSFGGLWILYGLPAVQRARLTHTGAEKSHRDGRPVKPVAALAETGVPSRPANTYERLALLSQIARTGTQKTIVKVVPPAMSPAPRSAPPESVGTSDAVDENRVRRIAAVRDSATRRKLLEELLVHPAPTDLDAFLKLMLVPACRDDALAVLRTAPGRPNAAALIARFNDAHVEVRFAAARALGTMCQTPVRAELRWMVEANVHRREALAALVCCEHADASTYLKAASADRLIDAQVRAVRGEMHRLF
jgi:hypothetical protein